MLRKQKFLGILIILVGGSFIYYSGELQRMLGRWKWAEEYLGGTRQGYVMVGFILMVLGFSMIFGGVKFGAQR